MKTMAIVKPTFKLLMLALLLPLISEASMQKQIQPFKEKVRPDSMLYHFDTFGHQTVIRYYTSNSVLSTGKWYKIGVKNTGIFKITYSDLVNMGINPSTINPHNIRIYGNGGGMLSESNEIPRPDDLMENAIKVVGEEDGSFDENDYILFYGQSPNTWTYNTQSQLFEHTKHLYSDENYYFLTVDLGIGKRIVNQNSGTLTPNTFVNTFNDYAFYEKDSLNFIHSGKEWYGEGMNSVAPEITLPVFSFPDRLTASMVSIKLRVAAKAFTGSSFDVFANQQAVLNCPVSGILPSQDIYYYAAAAANYGRANLPDTNLTIRLRYNAPTAAAKGWLDYLEINVIRNLIFHQGQLSFRNISCTGLNKITRFSLTSNTQNITIWDVSTPDIVQMPAVASGDTLQFVTKTDTLRQFIAFDNDTFLTPEFVGNIPNQNLHAINDVDFVIISPTEFLAQAQRLAQIHLLHDGLATVVVNLPEIYNEFSSGTQDVTAIRDFIKMLYDRSASGKKLQYVLFFGDGSYDMKNRILPNTNFIPTYQSTESLSITSSYVTDDYYGLMNWYEGKDAFGALDIGIGRFPVKNIEEATTAVDKVAHYYTNSSQTMGDWRNKICLVADDEDNNLHFNQAEEFAQIVDSSHHNININKIYLDSYREIKGSKNDEYPDVTKAINKQVNEGALIMNYTGHGGEVGWAEERVLTIKDINSWTNYDHMPLFFTGTCEFSNYDNPSSTSAGELVFLNAHGGGIAILTTTRVAFAQYNKLLNQRFYKNVFENYRAGHYRLGDLIRLAKNPPATHFLNFTLLGDPALQLAYPTYKVITTQINGKDVNEIADTLHSLSRVSISGEIQDTSGNKITQFSGTLHTKVFDKPVQYYTLGNDFRSIPAPFLLQNNLLYNGKTEVKNGAFTFEFVIPRDAALNYGYGKISYYANDGSNDASGYDENFVIGGLDPNPIADNKGPDIQLYMNDTSFTNGNVIGENAIFFANLSDSVGINTLGSGLGHDIMAVVDGDESNPIILNDSLQTSSPGFRYGTIVLPFENLDEGQHTIKLKAWDLYNNSSESSINFYVSKSIKLAINQVINYPNPFSDKTYFTFRHNQFGNALSFILQIYSIDGRLIKTFNKKISNTQSYLLDPIEWDGTDEGGQKTGKGVYVYRLKVLKDDQSYIETVNKLIIW